MGLVRGGDGFAYGWEREGRMRKGMDADLRWIDAEQIIPQHRGQCSVQHPLQSILRHGSVSSLRRGPYACLDRRV